MMGRLRRRSRFFILLALLTACLFMMVRLAGELESVRYFGCVLGLQPGDGALRNPDDVDVDRWCNVYRLDWNPRRSINNCPPLPAEPYPLICIHDPADDIFISASIDLGRLWEPDIVNRLREILEEDSGLGLLDIGANIGQFSLLAAKLGHPVVAVEAYIKHVEMIHKSVVLNQIQENFTLVYNAVSDEHNTVALSFKNGNMGAIRVIEANIRSEAIPRVSINKCRSTGSHVATITLDDLLEVITFDKAVLKLDIEGYEAKVMMQSAILLTRVHVPYIIMEWAILRMQQQEYQVEMIRSLFDFMQSHSYTPFTMHFEEKLSMTDWKSWPNDILWKQIGRAHV